LIPRCRAGHESPRVRFPLLLPDRPAPLRAAELWALVRRAGVPTADPHALDAAAILAAQASVAVGPGGVATIATGNARHLARFPMVDARDWATIA
jgi:hypothetical protein